MEGGEGRGRTEGGAGEGPRGGSENIHQVHVVCTERAGQARQMLATIDLEQYTAVVSTHCASARN